MATETETRKLEQRGAYFQPSDGHAVYVILYTDGAVRVGDWRAVKTTIEDDRDDRDTAWAEVYVNVATTDYDGHDHARLLPVLFATRTNAADDYTHYRMSTADYGDLGDEFSVFTNV